MRKKIILKNIKLKSDKLFDINIQNKDSVKDYKEE